jgi:hypothetical protein
MDIEVDDGNLTVYLFFTIVFSIFLIVGFSLG